MNTLKTPQQKVRVASVSIPIETRKRASLMATRNCHTFSRFVTFLIEEAWRKLPHNERVSISKLPAKSPKLAN